MRTMLAVFALIVSTAAAQGGAHAAEPTVKPGEYIAEEGSGTLKISSPSGGGVPFDLMAYGANFHECSLEGDIVSGQAKLETKEGAATCVVSFARKGDGIEISRTDNCREYYCGMRGEFAGLYLKPAAGCGRDALKSVRKEFKRLYDRKQYTSALAKLGPMPERCARTLDRYQGGDIRNDVAITQYKLGQRDACLRTLAPLEADAAMSDDDIRNTYPPGEATTWLPIMKATRFNLELCQKIPKR
jgi:hypothetical protein